MDEPELIKMLKYILLLVMVISCVQCHPLVTEEPSIVPVPIHHSDEQFSVVSSLIPTRTGGTGTVLSRKNYGLTTEDENAGSGGHVQMSPVMHISEIQDELELTPNNTGGQKHVRQTQEGESTPDAGGPIQPSPPPSDELCSIFQFFLEPRRYSGCRVSNTNAENERNEVLPPRLPPRPPVELRQTGTRFDFNPNFHRTSGNEVVPQSSEGDNYHSESETREIERVPQGQRQIIQLPPGMALVERREDRDLPPPPQPPPQRAYKRYDQFEDGPPPGLDDGPLLIAHPIPPPPGPPPMYPKSALDRTTIIVPDRPCRRGERRDHKGYCRRIVRPAPSYQYGPPPPPYGPSRPFRYYYSRFVSVPTLQFFIPAVP